MFSRWLVALLLCIALIPLAGPAFAGDGYVTSSEYQRAKVGMTKAKVHKIFGTTGRVVLPAGPGHPAESRHYRARMNGKKSCVAVDYKKSDGIWRLVGKAKFAPYQGRCA